MLYLDMLEAAPVAIYAAAGESATSSTKGSVRTEGICTIADMNAKGISSPMAELMGYDFYMRDMLSKAFVEQYTRGVSSDALRKYMEWSHSLDIEILRLPKHGNMVIQDDLDIYPSYLPTEGYIGKDRVDVLVKAKDLEGRPIAKKLVFFINVLSEKESKDIQHTKAQFQKYCGVQRHWRITKNTQIPDGFNGQASNLWAKSSYSITFNANAVPDGNILTIYLKKQIPFV